MILPCSCKHAYQDSKYGKGMRVHNLATKANNGKGAHRCTVCGNMKSVPANANRKDTK